MTTPRPPDGGTATPLTEEEARIQRDLGGKAWEVRGWCAVHQRAHPLRELMAEHADAARDSRPVGEGLREALAVYGLLVGRCGADEVHRDAFVSAWTAPTDMPFEWRFQGSLGFGGKVYRNAGRIYASCYREDETPERLDSIRSVNLWLDRLSRLQAGPAAVRPATEPRWFRDNEDDPERHCYRTEDGDEIVVYASREQAERMIAALSGAAVRPVEREGETDA